MAFVRSWILAAAAYFVVNFSIGSIFATDLYVYQTPSGVKLHKPDISLPLTQLADVFSLVNGYTIANEVEWNGIVKDDPLKRPKALLVLQVNSPSSQNIKLNDFTNRYVVNDERGSVSHVFSALENRIRIRYPDDKVTAFELHPNTIKAVKSQYSFLKGVPDSADDLRAELFGDGSVVHPLTFTHLNLTSEVDSKFLSQLQLYYNVAKQLEVSRKELVTGSKQDLIWIQLDLAEIMDNYGIHSDVATEAMELLHHCIKKICNHIVNAYDSSTDTNDMDSGSNIGVFIITTPIAHRRETRAADYAATKNGTWNLAISYDENYPAAFNIIFLTMIIFSLSIFAIALAIWHMDPGRDSIIYRMTSQRMRKDQ